MENNQNVDVQIPQWVKTWAEFILKQSNFETKLDENSIKLIEEILFAISQGDSCIPKSMDVNPKLGDLLIDENQANMSAAPFVSDEHSIYLYRYWKLESRLAQQVHRLKSQAITPVDTQAFEHLLEDQYQKQALNMVAENALNIITGGPGTGKTYTLARIIAVLSQSMPDIRIAMAAPTGKAAQRMKEALQHSLNDQKLNELGLISDRLKQQDTLTIHRLLGLGTQYKPRFHLKQPLPYDVIVIDEASMLDLNLATLLFEAVPDQCRLILLGDANQLASVDVGAVLADLQQVPMLQKNRVNLKTSRRFKEGALIGEFARFIQQQKNVEDDHEKILDELENRVIQPSQLHPISLTENMPDVVQLEYLNEAISDNQLIDYYKKLSFGYHDYFASLKTYIESDYSENNIQSVIQAFDHYRILAAIRHGAFGVDKLNQEIKKILLECLPEIRVQGDWYIGRPVMMSYNDYQLGLSNGDIGLCFKHRQLDDQYEVYFPSLDLWLPATRLPKSIETAFVLTIHKSQGSEFRHTAVVFDHTATKLLSQELIYTAITRAKSVVSLLVNRAAFLQSLTILTARSSGLVSKINRINLS